MAYDEDLAHRVRELLGGMAGVDEKPMVMGGSEVRGTRYATSLPAKERPRRPARRSGA